MATDKKLTRQEGTYLSLRNALMVGVIPPGTSLTMRGLAKKMNLSPTPVREALRRLSSERAIEVLDNRRLRVPLMSLGRFEDLIATRVNLEAHAAKRALPYVSDILIGDLRAIDDQMDELIKENDLTRLTQLNHDFHRLLYMANPFQTAMPLIESIWLQLGPFHRQAMTGLESFYTVDRHKEILGALTARDPVTLANAISDDIEDGIAKAGRKVMEQVPSVVPIRSI